MGGFWDKVSDGLSSGDFLGSAISTVGSTIAGLLLSDSQDDANEQAREDARADKLLQLKLEALKAKYGGGGGGGGGGGADNRLTPANILASMQNVHDSKAQAIRDLMAGYQNAVL